MIDYDKLKIAHELLEKYRMNEAMGLVAIQTQLCINGVIYALTLDNGECELFHNNLDGMIAKLQELTQPKPKYELGQEVWYVIYAREWTAISDKIDAIGDGYQKYHLSGNWWPEHQLYPTKLALIEGQMNYWHTLLQDEQDKCIHPRYQPPFEGTIKGFNECQHKSNGLHDVRTDFHSLNKCKKCGEFYK